MLTKPNQRLVRFTKKEEKEMRPTSRSVTLQTEIKSPRATSKRETWRKDNETTKSSSTSRRKEYLRKRIAQSNQGNRTLWFETTHGDPRQGAYNKGDNPAAEVELHKESHITLRANLGGFIPEYATRGQRGARRELARRFVILGDVLYKRSCLTSLRTGDQKIWWRIKSKVNQHWDLIIAAVKCWDAKAMVLDRVRSKQNRVVTWGLLKFRKHLSRKRK
ncbi:hypothetical protein HYC85_004430 [Camellia sinensis]|uniref:Uncharacterized protein n=1 Tax=Camellia sinensis TaxID=4442 RepID=A0A7J7HXJ8_CAMSI|nr:hypothetical protein HYC85_004430 [Camellia sinensis]